MVRSFAMLGPFVFIPLLLLTFGYALWRGSREERVAAGVCLAATVATTFVISPLGVRYSALEKGLLLVDLGVLAAFLTLALTSYRFWPWWVAGLQLTNSAAHLMKVVEADLLPKAYAAAAIFWSYPILFVIIIGTWRGDRRRAHQRRAAHAA